MTLFLPGVITESWGTCISLLLLTILHCANYISTYHYGGIPWV